MIRNPTGFVLVAERDDEILSSGEFEKLPEPERKKFQAAISDLQNQLHKTLHRF